MGDWQEYVSAIGGALRAASVVALLTAVGIYSFLRLLHAIPRLRKQHTWRTDLRPIRWVGPTAFVLVFLPGLFLGWLFSDMCGTSNSKEFRSPDGNHKVVVYAFDCGATTDFSLVVSLLGADDHLPKHRTARVLYSHYHQEPSTSNVRVLWEDSHRVLVKVVGFDGTPLVAQDDVSVRFEELR
jgi:hypothetical protein